MATQALSFVWSKLGIFNIFLQILTRYLKQVAICSVEVNHETF